MGKSDLGLKPKENDIGAIFNWHGKPIWEHYQIIGGHAKRISKIDFHELMKKDGIVILQPVYVED
jgi:hypothetical protein